jgi:hypothetical protein
MRKTARLAVLHRLSSPASRRVDEHAIEQFHCLALFVVEHDPRMYSISERLLSAYHGQFACSPPIGGIPEFRFKG